ncbi:MAG: hypothetical protein ACREJD_03415 [Phycisphaerales bacterium]
MTISCRNFGSVLGRGFVAALALFAGTLCAARGPEAVVNSALADLNSESIEARNKGAASLRAWAGLSPDRLLALINHDSSPEQRERLIGLAREVFFATPRGALGVSFGFGRLQAIPAIEEQFEEGIPIESTLAGFDSSNVLKGGDLLRAIDGCRIRTNLQCRLETISRDKGQVVQLEIERDGRPMRVSVTLGSQRDLRNQLPAPDVIESAWKLRLARNTTDQTGSPAVGAIPAQAWVEADRLIKEPVDPEAEIRRVSLQNPEIQVDRLMPDGSRMNVQRDGTPAADLVATGNPRTRVSTGTPQSRMLASRPQQFMNLPADNRNALIKRAQELRETRKILQDRVEAATRIVNDPNVPREQRQLMRQAVDDLQSELAGIEAQMAQLIQPQRNR